jgi:hypothetical protein
MPSSGLPTGGSRQTWSSSSKVRRQPQRGFPEAGGPGRVGGVNAQALDAYFHEKQSCPDEQTASNEFEVSATAQLSSARRAGRRRQDAGPARGHGTRSAPRDASRDRGRRVTRSQTGRSARRAWRIRHGKHARRFSDLSDLAHPPAVAVQDNPEREQPEVVLLARRARQDSPGTVAVAQPRARPPRRPRSTLLAKCSCATLACPRAHLSPRSRR